MFNHHHHDRSNCLLRFHRPIIINLIITTSAAVAAVSSIPQEFFKVTFTWDINHSCAIILLDLENKSSSTSYYAHPCTFNEHYYDCSDALQDWIYTHIFSFSHRQAGRQADGPKTCQAWMGSFQHDQQQRQLKWWPSLLANYYYRRYIISHFPNTLINTIFLNSHRLPPHTWISSYDF